MLALIMKKSQMSVARQATKWKCTKTEENNEYCKTKN